MKSLVHEFICGVDHVTMEFADGRGAALSLHPRAPFGAWLLNKDKFAENTKFTNMFPNLLEAHALIVDGAKPYFEKVFRK